MSLVETRSDAPSEAYTTQLNEFALNSLDMFAQKNLDEIPDANKLLAEQAAQQSFEIADLKRSTVIAQTQVEEAPPPPPTTNIEMNDSQAVFGNFENKKGQLLRSSGMIDGEGDGSNNKPVGMTDEEFREQKEKARVKQLIQQFAAGKILDSYSMDNLGNFANSLLKEVEHRKTTTDESLRTSVQNLNQEQARLEDLSADSETAQQARDEANTALTSNVTEGDELQHDYQILMQEKRMAMQTGDYEATFDLTIELQRVRRAMSDNIEERAILEGISEDTIEAYKKAIRQEYSQGRNVAQHQLDVSVLAQQSKDIETLRTEYTTLTENINNGPLSEKLAAGEQLTEEDLREAGASEIFITQLTGHDITAASIQTVINENLARLNEGGTLSWEETKNYLSSLDLYANESTRLREFLKEDTTRQSMRSGDLTIDDLKANGMSETAANLLDGRELNFGNIHAAIQTEKDMTREQTANLIQHNQQAYQSDWHELMEEQRIIREISSDNPQTSEGDTSISAPIADSITETHWTGAPTTPVSPPSNYWERFLPELREFAEQQKNMSTVADSTLPPSTFGSSQNDGLGIKESSLQGPWVAAATNQSPIPADSPMLTSQTPEVIKTADTTPAVRHQALGM